MGGTRKWRADELFRINVPGPLSLSKRNNQRNHGTRQCDSENFPLDSVDFVQDTYDSFLNLNLLIGLMSGAEMSELR